MARLPARSPNPMSPMNEHPSNATRRLNRSLTPVEGRVLGVLLEKRHTVPDTYPLTLNALTAGCNQKTARAPVMSVTEADIVTAIDGLKQLSLVFEGSGSRVPRFEENIGRALGIPAQSAALLATLLLRGPQTAAELRLNSSRLHDFADISAVEGFLDELERRDPALVVRLARAPGARESRWMHLLCGEVSPDAVAMGSAPGDAAAAPGALEVMRAEQQALVEKVDQLQAALA